MSYRKYNNKFNEHHPAFCPFCSGESTVVYSRRTDVGIERRRKCKECPGRWNTIEVLKDEQTTDRVDL